MQRFFLSPSAIQQGQVIIEGSPARQIRSVLRLKPGDRVMVLDNAGWEYEVVLSEVVADRASGVVEQKRPAEGEPALQVTLYQGLLKGEKFDMVLQKATELGVSRLVPLMCRRSIPRYKSAEIEGKMDRWRTIIQEAAEQCGRGRLPALEVPMPFKTACDTAHGISIMPWEGEKVRSFKEFLRSLVLPVQEGFNLLVGPEGGFEPEEVSYAQSHGVSVVSLGVRILRSETAALTALSVLMYELGELGG